MLGFYVDTVLCIGCRACQSTCKEKNHLAMGEFCRRVETLSYTQDGHTFTRHYSGACNHCADPVCVASCPNEALYKAPDGTVQHDDSKCIGCGRCVYTCPYGAPSISRLHGHSQKCDACADLRAQGLPPACVTACPTRALHFGELEELMAAHDGAASPDAPFLPGSGRTGPSLRVRLPLPYAAGAAPKSVAAHASTEKASFRRDTDETFVILGCGISAVRAAKAIRERNRTGRIILFSDESRPPYLRPLLSKHPLRGFSMEEHATADEAWFRANDLELRLNTPVAALDTAAKTVTLRSGETVSYDKCIYALGAENAAPPIKGLDREGVFTVRRSSDVERMRRRALRAKNAVLIGGGVIGVEIAWELLRLGLSVTILEAADHLMQRLLDAESSERLAAAFTRNGIPVVTGARITEIAGGENGAEGVALADGRFFPAELVVVATGIRSTVGIAREAGLEIGRSLVVNEYMETSAPDVYACGDCVEFRGMNPATWAPGMRQGDTAGANAAGERVEYEPVPGTILIDSVGVSLFALGDLGMGRPESARMEYVEYPMDRGLYRVNPRHGDDTAHAAFCYDQGKLIGAALLGDLSEIDYIQDAVMRREDEAAFKAAAGKRGIRVHG